MLSITFSATFPIPPKDFINSVTTFFLSHTSRLTAAAGTIVARCVVRDLTSLGLN